MDCFGVFVVCCVCVDLLCRHKLYYVNEYLLKLHLLVFTQTNVLTHKLMFYHI